MVELEQIREIRGARTKKTPDNLSYFGLGGKTNAAEKFERAPERGRKRNKMEAIVTGATATGEEPTEMTEEGERTDFVAESPPLMITTEDRCKKCQRVIGRRSGGSNFCPLCSFKKELRWEKIDQDTEITRI